MIVLFALFAIVIAAPAPKAKPGIVTYSGYSPYYTTYPYSYSSVYTYPSLYTPSIYGKKKFI